MYQGCMSCLFKTQKMVSKIILNVIFKDNEVRDFNVGKIGKNLTLLKGPRPRIINTQGDDSLNDMGFENMTSEPA